jgi:integrase
MTSAIEKRDISSLFLRTLKARERAFLIWDSKQGGLALSVQPSGHMAWKAIYSRHGRTRWYTIGPLSKVGLSDARSSAKKIMAKVALGEDPQQERVEEARRRKPLTFAELAATYLEYAQKNIKSWKQGDYLIRKHLLPRWGKRVANEIARSDVKEIMRTVKAPSVANQTLAAASAIYSWAIKEEVGGVKENPCFKVERNATSSRERVLSDSEIAKFWDAFDDAGLIAGTALKLILILGQRPGEIAHMRREHIIDGWWEMPGEAKPDVGWPGTKNAQPHHVWLSAPARDLIARLEDDSKSGFVFDIGVRALDAAMRTLCKALAITDKVTPHDLRRSFATRAAEMGIGEDAIDRVLNHKKRGVIIKTYNRYHYRNEDKANMEKIGARILALATGVGADAKVIPLRG